MTETLIPYNVSNSEAIAFISCKRMWEFAFGFNLAPKVMPDPLARGTLGHSAFEAYVNARLAGDSHESAIKAGLAVIQAAMTEIKLDVVMQVQFLWGRYMDHHNGWPEWELIGTEQRVDLQLTETLAMPIRYDLLVRERATGKLKIVDYKFAFNFWTPFEHDLNPQMPKYIGVMRANGEPVEGGFLEEIRTRDMKNLDPKGLWRRTAYNPPVKKIQSMLRQHVAVSMAIEKHKQNGTPQERVVQSIPVLNKYGVCQFCNFKSLCNSLNNGVTDLSVQMRTDFVDNTYGYNKQIFLDEI